MIPYGTAVEAEAALGRAMTWAEAAWFRYSAGLPDWLLLWHNVLFFLVLYTLAPLPLTLLEHLAPSVAMRYKLQPRARLSGDTILHYIRDIARVVLLIVGPYQLVFYASAKMAGIRMGVPLPSVFEIVAQLAVYWLVDDYLSYWIHRMLHTKWGYDKIHFIHHELTAPTGFGTAYGHWAEILMFSISLFIGPAMVPCHVTTYWIWFSVRLTQSIDIHSGYDLPFSPTKLIPFYIGAEFHDYHHYVAKSQSNFGSVFTYCDYIYGTDKGYRYHKASLEKSKTKPSTDGEKTRTN